MDRYTFQAKTEVVLNTITSSIPKILKSILNILSFIIYIITLLWVLCTSIITLSILYVGAGASYLSERINNEN